MKNYVAKIAEIANKAAMDINSYKGSRAEQCATGETIIKHRHKNVSVVIVIGGNEPIVRDCVEHKMREDSAVNGWKFADNYSRDVFMLDAWSYEDICQLADELYNE